VASATSSRPPASRSLRTVAVALAAVLLVGLGYGLARSDEARSVRLEAVAAAGSEVMPFDLDRTTHVFADVPDGGTQTVTADDPSDTGQVRLVQGHLAEEAEAFAAGDFDDPSAVHGEAMPGLEELRGGADRIEVRYADLADGGRITYRTEDPALVGALHAWFGAQTSDHGSHAQPGH